MDDPIGLKFCCVPIIKPWTQPNVYWTIGRWGGTACAKQYHLMDYPIEQKRATPHHFCRMESYLPHKGEKWRDFCLLQEISSQICQNNADSKTWLQPWSSYRSTFQPTRISSEFQHIRWMIWISICMRARHKTEAKCNNWHLQNNSVFHRQSCVHDEH